HYHTLAESNRIALLPEVPQRGRILDRKHRVLAENFPVYTLEITPSKVPDLATTIVELSALVAISASDRQHFYKLREAYHDYESIPIRTHLSDLEVARFSVNTYRFPGVIIKSKLYRHYPYGKLGSHVIGYIGRINDKDRTSLQLRGLASNYKGSEYIGKAGIEQYYEQNLHGQTGFLQLETNANGQAVREMQRVPAIAGHDIILSLDSYLQEVAERAFGKYRGALVAIQPQSGEILAYVSMPTLDPNLFVDGIDTDSWLELNESADKPLINRPLRGIYPPGSTFKPFVALAGLHANLRYPPYAIQDTGHFSLGNNGHRYRDWKPTGHGRVDMQKAITVSCDTFFYGLAQELGIKKLSDFVANFGFGKKTGIDMLGEAQGLLPTPEWKWRRFKQPWYQGETVITGIGQGYTLVTPLQLAFATAVLANNGIAVRPHLALQISDSQTGKPHPLSPTLQQRLNLNPADLALVRRGMIDVTLAGGTAAGIGQSA
ncbi:MAG: penicillin-binding protein 2, partial [Methylophilaceae bacterium]|nr:penicillin-binding protein 2 [Methylophilaceae bacterium]